jgi:hypothetical protein
MEFYDKRNEERRDSRTCRRDNQFKLNWLHLKLNEEGGTHNRAPPWCIGLIVTLASLLPVAAHYQLHGYSQQNERWHTEHK